MALPELKYLRVKDVIKRWTKMTGEDIDYQDVFEYFRQGILQPLKFTYGDYVPIGKGLLSLFDLRYVDLEDIDDIGEIHFKDINHPIVDLLEGIGSDYFDVKIKDIYVDIAELRRIEAHDNKYNNNQEKPLHPKEKSSLYTLLLVFAKLAKCDINHPYSISETIIEEAESLGLNISENTIDKFLKKAMGCVSTDTQKLFSDL